jgi:D-arabinan endo alpha-(1,5)-arabinofuranosidase
MHLPLHAKTGSTTRRRLLKAGVGLAIGAGVATTGTVAAFAGGGSGKDSAQRALVSGSKVADLSGPDQTGSLGAAWTDLGVPALCPDGSMLFACGDTFDGAAEGQGTWLAPVGLRSSSSDLGSLRIDSGVGGSHVASLVPEGHDGGTTAIPSDIFTIGDTMYMHLMRGVLYNTDHSDFWRSTDNGNTWEYLCQWPGNQYDSQFQQKTYAVADDGYCYVLSTVFNRTVESGLLLHRVPQDQLGNPDAYDPWGYANGAWGWGNYPTTINGTRKWGEICFRAMGGKYAFTWLDLGSLTATIRAQVFPLPTSDLTTTAEQVLITASAPGLEAGTLVASPYGGFIVPGSTFDNFHIIVSQWYNSTNYRFMHYQLSGLRA